MGIINSVKSSFIGKQIDQLDPEGIGEKAADFIDKVCDDSLKNHSESLQVKIAKFANRFCMAFCKRLVQDQKRG